MTSSHADDPRHGKISTGLERKTLVEKTIEFVRGRLQPWRDDASRSHVDAEDDLNSQLCKFLDVEARKHFPMVRFNHQERQGRRRSVDLSATPSEPIRVGSRDYSIYVPFLVLEGKRLPAPTADREREYLTGYEQRSGGVQRFKLGLHGAGLKTAVMIGYLQEGAAEGWRRRLNKWIAELANSPATEHDDWARHERLRPLAEYSSGATTQCQSSHPRGSTASASKIRLFHLWIKIGPRAARRTRWASSGAPRRQRKL